MDRRAIEELFERNADMRLLEFRHAEPGKPPKTSTRSASSFSAESIVTESDDLAPDLSPRLRVAIAAEPRAGVIPGAVVGVAIDVFNDGGAPAPEALLLISLPAETEYRANTLRVDGREVPAPEQLFAQGLPIARLPGTSSSKVTFQLAILPGVNTLYLQPRLQAGGVPVVGTTGVGIKRGSSPLTAPVAATPFYELETDEADEVGLPGEEAIMPPLVVDHIPVTPLATAPVIVEAPAPVAAAPVVAPPPVEPELPMPEPAMPQARAAVAPPPNPEPAATVAAPPLPEPVAALPEPVAALPEPVAALPEPVAALPEPVAARPEPVAAQAAPIAPQPEPVAAQAEPVEAQPQPIAPQAEPVAPQPGPIAAQPEPIGAQPVPQPDLALTQAPQLEERPKSRPRAKPKAETVPELPSAPSGADAPAAAPKKKSLAKPPLGASAEPEERMIRYRSLGASDIALLDRLFRPDVPGLIAHYVMISSIACSEPGSGDDTSGYGAFLRRDIELLGRALVHSRMGKAPQYKIAQADLDGLALAWNRTPQTFPPQRRLRRDLRKPEWAAIGGLTQPSERDATLRTRIALLALAGETVDGIEKRAADECSAALATYRSAVLAWLVPLCVASAATTDTFEIPAPPAQVDVAGRHLAATLKNAITA